MYTFFHNICGTWIKKVSFRRGLLNELEDFTLSNTLKETGNWWLLVRMKIGCLKVFLTFLILSIKNEPNLFANDFSSSKDGGTVAFDELNILFIACHCFLQSPQFSLTRSW